MMERASRQKSKRLRLRLRTTSSRPCLWPCLPVTTQLSCAARAIRQASLWWKRTPYPKADTPGLADFRDADRACALDVHAITEAGFYDYDRRRIDFRIISAVAL